MLGRLVIVFIKKKDFFRQYTEMQIVLWVKGSFSHQNSTGTYMNIKVAEFKNLPTDDCNILFFNNKTFENYVKM